MLVFKNIDGGAEAFVQTPARRNALLTLLIDRNSKLPAEQRDWKDVDELMAASAKVTPNAPDLLPIDAAVREQKGDRAGARQMLEAALAKDRKNAATWLSLGKLAYSENGAQAAIKLLDEAKADVGDDFSLQNFRL